MLRAGEEVLVKVFNLLGFVGESTGSWNAFYRDMLHRADLIKDTPRELNARASLKRDLQAIAVLALQESLLAHAALINDRLLNADRSFNFVTNGSGTMKSISAWDDKYGIEYDRHDRECEQLCNNNSAEKEVTTAEDDDTPTRRASAPYNRVKLDHYAAKYGVYTTGNGGFGFGYKWIV